MKVSDLMLPGVQTVTPSQAIHDAQALVADGGYPAQPGEYDELLELLTEHGTCTDGVPNAELVSGVIGGVFANEDGPYSARNKAGEHL
ncbi:hypothetical protein [Phytopseudomonas punonensis]|uniref:Uncharacterized protein n=1 Tax=Phytopseudomonas punonensis TaxID=1220495 RepID=A0A1M7DT10_9GAMM|nr:hypothetical protein [Pseudomonas punonensis]SHL82635.1 hypothetical protein SAMN05216288_2560 [Pseudomonas punonensis]